MLNEFAKRAVTMGYTKTILCLANSRKPPDGRCIAGRELNGTGFDTWIRPVSARPTRELSLRERRYHDGGDPSLLDVISIEMTGPQPWNHQQENHLIDVSRRWVKRGAMTWQGLQSAVEDVVGPLWLNGNSSYHGQNDRVAEDRIGEFTRSLYLIRTQRLRLVVATEDDLPPRRRVRAQFEYCGHFYRLPVTDPFIEDSLLARDDVEIRVSEAILCVSLGEPFHGFAYKLAAAVMTPKRAGA